LTEPTNEFTETVPRDCEVKISRLSVCAQDCHLDAPHADTRARLDRHVYAQVPGHSNGPVDLHCSRRREGPSKTGATAVDEQRGAEAVAVESAASAVPQL
jgi:hypothetical protein